MTKWVDVKLVDAFPNNTRELVDLDFTTVIVFNIDNQFYAIDHLCTHADFGLEDADCNNGVITCPYHGAKFCVRTGAALTPPAFEDIEIYEVRVQDGMVQVAEPK
jgi:3-phenylpropionate/trans-cinnamate dioxygenase ferredoxin subunit